MNSGRVNQDIGRLRRAIQDTLGWGEARSWHSKMFDELSTKIFEETNVMISVPTLKRFFKVVNHQGSPSVTTLDALSKFVGKENWRSFKTTKTTSRILFKTPGKSVYITVGFVLALVTIGLIGNKRPELVINASEFSFSSKVLSTEYPNSVVFDFEIPNDLHTDSIYIQQYWDPTKTIAIKPQQTQATGIYYFPGYFKAMLMVDGQQAQAHDLFLPSDGWLGMIEYSSTPKYFEPILEGSAITFPNHIINEVSAREEPVVSSFHFIKDLGEVSGDDFSLTTTIRSTFDDRWAVCQAMSIYFIGTSGAMIIPFSKIGCSSDHNLMLNDVFIRGKESDLSSLSADFSNPVNLTIKVVNKTVSVYQDQKLLYSNQYQSSMGALVGLRFKFKGLGEVISYQVQDDAGRDLAL